jgi:CPA2 family monovalent cation:H+ antiporter-2
MFADSLLFRDLAFVLTAAVFGGLAARLAGQPLIVGFVLGGMVIGPFTPGPSVSDLHALERFAEIGVVLLMFSIGIEFSLKDLLRMKGVALIGGPLGILLTVAMGTGVGTLLGWPPLQGAVVGIVISVASTMVLVQILMDRGELHTTHGRIMVAIALVEDLAVVVMTVLLPALGALEPGRLVAVGEALLLAAAILVPFFYLAAKVAPRIMGRVAATRSEELFLLVALIVGVGTAAVTQAVGLTPALGAFLGGLLISGSDYAHQALARLLPLRDVFVALFFVTIGALIDPVSVLGHLPLLAALVGLILVGKLAIRTALAWIFGYSLRTSLLVGFGFTQIGEFSFVLVQVAREAGHVGAEMYHAVLSASLITVLVNAALIRHVPDWVASVRLRTGLTQVPPETPPRHVLVCGFGRVGSAIGEALETFGIPFVVIERDPDVIRDLRARRIPALFGDAGNQTVLQHAGAATATLIIVAVPEIQPAERAVLSVRAMNPHVPLLARAHRPTEAETLRVLGATEVIQPEVEASATLIRHALALLGLPKERAIAYLERFRGAMLTGRADDVAGPMQLPHVEEIRLDGDAFVEQTLRDSKIRERFGVTVVAIARENLILFNPAPETILHSGDVLRVFGLSPQIAEFAVRARQGRERQRLDGDWMHS